MIPGAKPSSENDSDDAESESSLESKEQGNGDEEEDIEDFIVEDDEGGNAALPAEFSMVSHQDLTHHFKVVCQYLVHLAVTAPRSRLRRVKKLQKGTHRNISRESSLFTCSQMNILRFPLLRRGAKCLTSGIPSHHQFGDPISGMPFKNIPSCICLV